MLKFDISVLVQKQGSIWNIEARAKLLQQNSWVTSREMPSVPCAGLCDHWKGQWH